MPLYIQIALWVVYTFWSLVEIIVGWDLYRKNSIRQQLHMPVIKYSNNSKHATWLWMVITLIIICYFITGGK